MLFLAATAGFYLYNYQTPMKEMIYMDFMNNYLIKNKVKSITLAKDRGTSTFSYRAEIETYDDGRFYMTLGNHESFLQKLDMIQREMGRAPNQYIPVKYSNRSDTDMNSMMLNLLVGGMAGLFLYQMYKGRNGSNMNTGRNLGKKGKGAGQEDKNKGGWFGNRDIFGVGKSNVTIYGEDKKIETKFKDVAGLENAKEEVMEFVDFLKNPKKY